MNYIEFNFQVNPKHPFTDILVAQLADVGFESFCETDSGVQAYIQECDHSIDILKDIEILNAPIQIRKSFFQGYYMRNKNEKDIIISNLENYIN